MKDKRFLAGIVVTVVWLGFSVYMFVTQPHPTQLNTWGDFFAGFFAPLAFLWLVIGYLQQGEELKHSTEALRLQAEELRNSVEQQSQLVAVSREQMKQEHDALQEERELRRDASRPKFVPQHWGTTVSGGVVEYKLKLVNVGNTATKVLVIFEKAIENPSSYGIDLFPRNDAKVIDVRFVLTTPSEATIKYVDADGLPGEVRFPIQAPGGNALQIGEVKRVL